MRTPLTALLTGLVLAAGAVPIAAEVAPGDRITNQNVDKVKDLISPGLEWCIRHGFPLTITETKRIEWPQAYRRRPRRGPRHASAPAPQ